MRADRTTRAGAVPDYRWAAGVVAGFLLIYTLSFTATFRADDEHILASRAISLSRRGTWEQPQVFGNQRIQSLLPMGDAALQIEPAQSILAVPLVSLAASIGLGQAQAVFSLNLYITALTTGIVFLIVRSIGYRPTVAVWCAAFFGAGTQAWPYSTTLFRDPVAMFFTGLAFLGWAQMQRSTANGRRRGAALMAFGVVAGVLTKNVVVALVPSLIGWVALQWITSGPNDRTRIRRFVGIGLGFASILLVQAAIRMSGPLARFSLEYYADLASHFVGSLDPSLPIYVAGPLLSPAKSVLVFSPALILSAIGVLPSWKRHRWFAVPALSFAAWISIAQALFYRELWAGSTDWGLRFMLPALPPLVVLAAPAIDSMLHRRARSDRLVLALVGIAGSTIQLAGVVVGWNWVYLEWQSQGLNPFSPYAPWSIRFNTIPGQFARLFQPSTWSVAWYRVFGPAGAVVVVIIALVVTMALILTIKKHQPGRPNRSWLLWPICAGALVFPGVPLWWVYRDDPGWGGTRTAYTDMLRRVEEEVSEGDVLVVNSYASPLWGFWLNRWSKHEPWFSLAFEIPDAHQAGPDRAPSELTQSLVTSLESSFGRLWYLTSSETPGYGIGGESKWLAARFPLTSVYRFAGVQADGEAWLFELRQR